MYQQIQKICRKKVGHIKLFREKYPLHPQNNARTCTYAYLNIVQLLLQTVCTCSRRK